jgi:hypothetical protein
VPHLFALLPNILSRCPCRLESKGPLRRNESARLQLFGGGMSEAKRKNDYVNLKRVEARATVVLED